LRFLFWAYRRWPFLHFIGLRGAGHRRRAIGHTPQGRHKTQAIANRIPSGPLRGICRYPLRRFGHGETLGAASHPFIGVMGRHYYDTVQALKVLLNDKKENGASKP